MLAKFPELSAVDFQVRDDLRRLTAGWRHYHQFSFLTMWSWDNGEDRVAEINGNLAYLTSHPASGRRALTLCGQHALTQSARTLLQYSRASGLSDALHLVPRDVAMALAAAGLRTEFDRAASEYVLNVASVLPSSSGSGKRRRAAAKFAERHQPVVHTLDLRSQKTRGDILEVADKWLSNRIKAPECKDHRSVNDPTSADVPALRKLLERANCFNLVSVGLRVSGELIAFDIFEHADDVTSIAQFRKVASRQFAGASEFLLIEIARRHCGDKRQINFAEDLGIATLRQYKTSLRPECFAEKYWVREQ